MPCWVGPFTVHLISIEYSVEEMAQRISAIYRGIAERTGIAPAADYRDWTEFHGGYLGAGYEKPTPESLAAIRTFASREGLLFENTYTAKPAAALLDLVAKGALPRDEPVCLLHTGGVPALFAQADLFA